MSEINTGGPAFPLKEPLTSDSEGMTLRDYFAAKAMQGMMAQSHHTPGVLDWTSAGRGWGEDCANSLNRHEEHMAMTMAGFAYQIADAMLKTRQS